MACASIVHCMQAACDVEWSTFYGETEMRTTTAVLTFLACVMAATSVDARVLLPTNGDFEGDTFVGRGDNLMPVEWDNANNIIDGGWGNPTVDTDYETDGLNGYVVVSIDGTNATPGGYAVVFQEPLMSLAELGIPVGTEIVFSADINDLTPGGSGPGAILKVEYYLDDGAQISNDEKQIAVAGSNWASYAETFTIPETTVDIKFVFGVSTGWGGPNADPSSFAFDNLKIGVSGGTPALLPVPIVGAGIDPANNVISWTNPEGAVSADVYLLESATELTNPVSQLIQPGNLIADDTTAQSLTVPSIKANRYYYWAVDVDTGALGSIWSFQTFDGPVSDVNAGGDQYLWLEAGSKTFTLNGAYSDDGESNVTVEWTNTTAAADTDPATSVVIADPTSLTTEVTVDNTGWFEFTLTVTDAVSSVADQVNVGVYVDACAAAKADPGDIAATYPNGHGDINGDCKTDMRDLALLAESWVECMSPKLGCDQ